jgi:hypothetical protein
METRINISDIEPNRFNHQYSEVKRCPRCQSVFITDTECESCHFQLKLDLLGEPIGDRSFYSIRENYWDKLGIVAKKLDFIEHQDKEKVSRYTRKLLFRYNVLLDYFYNVKTDEPSRRKLYFQELKDLIIELITYDVSEDNIWKKLDDVSDCEDNQMVNPLYQKIIEVVQEARAQKTVKKSAMELFFSYRILGSIRVSVAIVMILGLSLTVSMALSFFKLKSIY